MKLTHFRSRKGFQLLSRPNLEYTERLVDGLEHDFYDVPFSWEFPHPNWLIFFGGVGLNHQPGKSCGASLVMNKCHIKVSLQRIWSITFVTMRMRVILLILNAVWYNRDTWRNWPTERLERARYQRIFNYMKASRDAINWWGRPHLF